jgi:type I restriction enzyme M protein
MPWCWLEAQVETRRFDLRQVAGETHQVRRSTTRPVYHSHLADSAIWRNCVGKRATATIEAEIYQVEGFDVRFVGSESESGPYVDPYPYERAANSSWTVKKWRMSRWEPTYTNYDVDVLDAGGTPVHGKTLLSSVRATYDLEEGGEEKEGQLDEAASLPKTAGMPAVQSVDVGVRNPNVTKAKGINSPATDIYDVADRLWATADELRANSALKASEYSVPVLGLIFLKFADSRFAQAENELEGTGSSRRVITKANYQAKGVLYLPEAARFANLLELKEGDNLGKAINDAMGAIEVENPSLKGVLPRTYQSLTNDTLVSLLRSVNSILGNIQGDAFGKVYEYFLGKFAVAEGAKGGEYFTPTPIVRLIVEIIEPFGGKILDPACGSGGMFVQSARFVDHHSLGNGGHLSIYGQERVEETLDLCKMNLAVHGLEGQIAQSNTYYEDPFDSVGQFDFVMANPPFNVNKIDRAKLEGDKRFSLGLPKSDNGNYIWIQAFYSALNEKGRAGFVMANSAGDAGGSELEIRKRLINEKAVDVIVAVGSNFFYTVTLPVTLWFFDRGKGGTDREGAVLFIDARKIFRQIDRAHRDWTPDQIEFMANIVRLYRGEATESVEGSARQMSASFPDGLYTNVPGLCAAATLKEIEKQSWSLNPGRYVGVEVAVDDGVDFRERLEELNEELEALNQEAAALQGQIAANVSILLGQ